MSEDIAIRTEQLGKTYDNGVIGLSRLDLTVRRGEIFGFLGPNGAGKTTTVRLLNGTLTPTSGESKVLGIVSSDETVRRKTSTLAELAHMYESMSVYENLQFFASLYDLSTAAANERIEQLLTRMQLWEKRDLKLGSFSTGMKKRVHLARVLLHEPELIFLDEPTAGLDPEKAKEVTDLIRKLAEENKTTIFLCTHNLPLAERICDSFGFITDGSMVVSGAKSEIISSVQKENIVIIKTTEGEHRHPFKDQTDINALIKKVMDKGQSVTEVVQLKPTLEDAYFHYIGRSGDEME